MPMYNEKSHKESLWLFVTSKVYLLTKDPKLERIHNRRNIVHTLNSQYYITVTVIYTCTNATICIPEMKQPHGSLNDSCENQSGHTKEER